MSVSEFGYQFTGADSATRFFKNALYRSGWTWTGKYWFLKESRRPGKTLLIELPNWRSAWEWELKMRKPATPESEA